MKYLVVQNKKIISNHFKIEYARKNAESIASKRKDTSTHIYEIKESYVR